ncbi:MAG: hypothetical protein K0R14_1345 [Burkholderiales bacterium]|jgi:hypothetical protein|nr:hypothetical protein [Burkholderiales bacterium]
MIEKVVKLLILCLWVSDISALGLADFVPGFIASGPTESSDPNMPIKPLVTTKRNNSANHNSWYCNRTREDGKSNVFCKDNESSTAARVITYSNSEHDDKSKVVDMSSGGTVQSTANQSALLDQSTRNEMYKYNNNFSVPIQPSKNVNMNVGQNKLDVNIKY